MYKIIDNKNNIEENEVTEIIKRVKAIMINSDNEVLLGYANNIYQFPGGHVENEELSSALEREIKEETGIILNINSSPFASAYRYYKDFPEEGKNRKNEIYYYEIKTDKLPNLDNTNYTAEEMKGNFELRYININNLIEEITNNKNKYGDIKGIASEMIEIINIYLNNYYKN